MNTAFNVNVGKKCWQGDNWSTIAFIGATAPMVTMTTTREANLEKQIGGFMGSGEFDGIIYIAEIERLFIPQPPD